MANKFNVFVLFAAAAQASLPASDLGTAKEKSRTEWYQMGETICKAVRDNSLSITAAEAEYKKHQTAGGEPLIEAAQLANHPKLKPIASAESTANRDALFKSLKLARECKNYSATTNAIGMYQNSLQYARFLTVWHPMTEDKGSPTPAVNALKNVYATLFNEIQKLAAAVSEGRGGVTCDINKIHAAVDQQINVFYSWLPSKHK